ncbi:MAG: 4Fe-4S binding protein [Verrucomicrobiia bacterium]|jgi:NADH-quinone oxidoreductase subunit I
MGFIGKGLFEGMVVTARNFVGSYFDKERLVTVQYPEERVQTPENSRTFPFLVYDDDKSPVDTMRCVACKICEVECPPQCIYIVMDRDEKGKPRQRPKVFDIDTSVCMQCQICVEVCPFDAIKMDNDYEKSQYDRFDELVEHLPDLLKSNEYYNRIKPTEATAVDAKLKAEKEKKAKKAAPAAAAKPAAPPPKPAAPAAPKPAPVAAAAPAAKLTIPDDAPFTPEQRQWLSGFLSAVSVGAAPVAGAAAPSAPAKVEAAAPAEPQAAPAAAPAAEAPAGNWPWHDPGMGMQQRLDLAKSAPLADKLMAAMAQTDCHACGYDCRGYADAIAGGAESDLSLCLPGEAETANMLKKLMGEAGKA